MSEYRERLMKLDSEAQKLVESLTKIKDETVKLSSAKASLEEISKQLAELLSSSNKLFNDAQKTISVLGEVGTPEIISSVDKSSENITKSNNESIEQAKEEISSRINVIENTLGSIEKQIENKMKTAYGMIGVVIAITIIQFIF